MLKRGIARCSALAGAAARQQQHAAGALAQQQQQQPQALALLARPQPPPQAAWQLAARRSLFSSAEAGQGGGGGGQQAARRSILDASLPAAGEGGGVLGSAAAAARLRALQEQPAAPSFARRAARFVWNVLWMGGLGLGLGGAAVWNTYSLADVEAALADAQGQPDPSLPAQAWEAALRSYLRVAVPLDQKIREYADPSCDTLLPEMAPELVGRVKTLVLDLEGLLVHKEWSRAKGWQVLKRPGVEAFLLEMGRRYEVVLYTDEAAMYADPVINKIDPHRAITYRLYRQDTQYKNGKHVRDLSKLNRDLNQVLFVSANPDAYAFQPENALKLAPWDPAQPDTTLLDLIPFLQMVQEVQVQDIRDVVRSYDGEADVAAAFKARMAALATHKKAGGRFGKLGSS